MKHSYEVSAGVATPLAVRREQLAWRVSRQGAEAVRDLHHNSSARLSIAVSRLSLCLIINFCLLPSSFMSSARVAAVGDSARDSIVMTLRLDRNTNRRIVPLRQGFRGPPGAASIKSLRRAGGAGDGRLRSPAAPTSIGAVPRPGLPSRSTYPGVTPAILSPNCRKRNSSSVRSRRTISSTATDPVRRRRFAPAPPPAPGSPSGCPQRRLRTPPRCSAAASRSA